MGTKARTSHTTGIITSKLTTVAVLIVRCSVLVCIRPLNADVSARPKHSRCDASRVTFGLCRAL